MENAHLTHSHTINSGNGSNGRRVFTAFCAFGGAASTAVAEELLVVVVGVFVMPPTNSRDMTR